LAREANTSVDDVLLVCWDLSLDDVNDPNHFIPVRYVPEVRRRLGLRTKKELISIEYWTNYLEMSFAEFQEFALDLDIHIGSKTRILPKGALKKLNRLYPVSASKVVEPTTSINRYSISHNQEDFEIPLIGKDCSVEYVQSDEIRLVHNELVQDFKNSKDPIFPSGVKNETLLESALMRPQTGFGNVFKYPSVELSAAALLHSIVHNHPFHNGNKRTALVGLLVMLDKNGLVLTASEDQVFKYIIKVAQHKLIDDNTSFYDDKEVVCIAQWIKENSRNIEKGNRPISWNRLERILNGYNCSIEHSSSGGSQVTITRQLKASKWYKKDQVLLTKISIGNSDLRVSTIVKVRRDLKLDEKNGCDSDLFYSKSTEHIDTFINRYRKTLDRLARL
jgi:death-on-curing family protein